MRRDRKCLSSFAWLTNKNSSGSVSEDMVIVAVNEAIRKASEAMEKGIEAAKGGLSIPGLF